MKTPSIAYIAMMGLMVPVGHLSAQTTQGEQLSAAPLETLRQQKTELDKKLSEADKKRRAIRAVLEKSEATEGARTELAAAEKAYREFLNSDPSLKELSKAIDQARNATQAERNEVARSSKAGQSIREERAELRKKTIMLEYDQRLADFMVHDEIQRRLYREDPDLRKATAERRMLEQQRKNVERGDQELANLRQKAEAARATYATVLKEKTPSNLKEARQEARKLDQAYRSVVSSKTTEWNTKIQDARKAETAARQAMLESDKEAIELRKTLSELRREQANLAEQIRRHEFQLREGVGRRVGTEPEVIAAMNQRRALENTRRSLERSDPEILAARKARDEAHRMAKAEEKNFMESNAVTSAAVARAEASDAYQKLLESKTSEINERLQIVRAKEKELVEAKLQADASAREWNEKKAEAIEAKAVGQERSKQLDEAWKTAYNETMGAESVVAALDTEQAARKAYDEGYSASEAAKLNEARRSARNTLRAQVSQLASENESFKEAEKEYSSLRQQSRELQRRIKAAEKAAEPKPES